MEKNSTILEIIGSVTQHGVIRKNIQVSDYAFIWSWRAGVLQSLAPTRDVRYDDFWSLTIKVSPRSAFEEIS